MSVPKSNGPIIDPALCRCCRAIKKCRVLTAEYNWMGKKEVYADMVMDCFGILLSHVDDNEKDSGVCATCVVRLREAIAFRRQVLQCEELFLQAKLAPQDEESGGTTNYESKLKKLELESLELKTEPKDYNSDHNSIDIDDHGLDDALHTYSDDEDNKPLKAETKPADPLPPKEEEVKSEESEDYNGSSSDSDEPIKKKAKRKAKAKANGAKKKPAKAAKKQKADTDTPSLNEEIIIKDEIKMELEVTDGSIEDTGEYFDVPIEIDSFEIPLENPEVKKKRQWIREKSGSLSELEQLESEANEDLYFNFFNMSKSSFEELHSIVEEAIEKTDTHMRKCVSSKERLAICLRHFRTGQSHLSLATRYNVGVSTVSTIVKEVSRALWGVLQPIYMPAPREHTWRQSQIGFQEAYSFPNCVGSIAGRHIIAKHKLESEYPKVSDLACHRRFVTIALLAVTDPYHKIVALDIGNYAKAGDGNIIEESKFYSKYMDRKNFLPPTPLPGDTRPCPYVLIGDGTLTGKYNLLRPFPRNPMFDDSRKTFNLWLDRACTADRTFQMLMDSWPILHRPMEVQVESAVAVMKAICCLHNFILEKEGKLYPIYPNMTNKILLKRGGRKKLKGLKPLRPSSHRPTNVAISVRDRFVGYFSRLDPIQPVKATIGSISEPSESVDTVESLQQPDETIDETIVSLHQPNDTIAVTDESLNQPIQFAGDSVQSSNQPIESINALIDSLTE